MRYDVDKVLFVGLACDKATFFLKAQRAGFIEFFSQSIPKEVALESTATFLSAIKYLKQEDKAKPKEVDDPFEIAKYVVCLAKDKESQEERLRVLKGEIARIAPFGDFSLEEVRNIEALGKRHIQFFCVKRAKAHKVQQSSHLVYISTQHDMDYFISISPHLVSFSEAIEMHFTTSLSDLEEHLRKTKEVIAQAHKELRELAACLPALQEALLQELDVQHLNKAKEGVSKHLDEYLFAVEAWIPRHLKVNIPPLLDGLGIYFERLSTEEGDLVPTYLENKGLAHIGEDLVHVYDTPSHKDEDPSSWVFWSFLVFFSMIVADAGYGMIYLLLGLGIRYKFPYIQGFGRRFIKLMILIAMGCVAWGFCVGSYFGIELAPDSLLRKCAPVHYLVKKKVEYYIQNPQDADYQEWVKAIPALAKAKTPESFLLQGHEIKQGKLQYTVMNSVQDGLIMEFALLIGMLHIALSLLRSVRRDLSHLGWVCAIFGGYLYFPALLHTTSSVHALGLMSKVATEQVGLQLLLGGIAVAILLALIQHRWKGLASIAKSIEIFADILSYLRLYALGLAGMILASTFNSMGEKVGFVFGFLIILVGHGLNIVLGIMGGIIHGLRLNFIEWYHHSFEGGGRLFNPLRRLYRH